VAATVLIARALLPAGRERLEDRAEIRVGGLDVDSARLLDLAREATVIVADPTVAVDAELLDAAGASLRLVANFAVGYDNVDLDACRERGVMVTNTPGVLTNATAELALGLTLAAARRITETEAELRAGRWIGWDPGDYLGEELSGATFAVIGLGRIGRRYAELVRPMAERIVYVAESPKPEAERDLDAERLDLEGALAAAEVVSIHAPGGEATRHLIGAEQLGLMKPSAILINTSRGTLVDSKALAVALRERWIAAAGLDVYEHEPSVPSELLEAPRCVLLPHIGSATTKARNAMASGVADNVLAVLDGREPPDRVA
jgi:glyoxylate reductase